MNPRTSCRLPLSRLLTAALLLPWIACTSSSRIPSTSDSGTDAGLTNDGGTSGPPTTQLITAWSVTDLGDGRCIGVNDLGQVVGIDGTTASFIAQPGQARIALGDAPDAGSAMATAINANGEVVGYSQSEQGRAAIHYANGAWTFVPGLTGAWSVAVGIEGSDRIVGMGASASGMQGFLVVGGAAQDLQLGVPNSAVYAVTADNRVMGVFQTDKMETHAFWKAEAALVDLGTFGGANSMPYAMNGRGDVVGAAETAGGPRHAFVAWSGTATLTDLGASGGMSSEARGVSAHGQIAGNIYDAKHLSRPVVFVVGQSPIELLPTDSTSPYYSAHVVGMSPAGNIVGWALRASPDAGATPNGARCLVWTPKGGS